MKTYTKEQLIAAQISYNKEVYENPDSFLPIDLTDISETKALSQVEYLLSLIPEDNE